MTTLISGLVFSIKMI